MRKIYGIAFNNCYGQRVSLYEDDFYSHEAFMAERRSLKAKGIVFTDLFTSKESRKNKSKKATPKKCSKK